MTGVRRDRPSDGTQDLRAHGLRVREAVVRVLRQRARKKCLHRRGYARTQRGELGRLGGDVEVADPPPRVGVERHGAGQQLEQDDTDGIEIGPAVDRPAGLELLGGHVVRRAHHVPRAGQRGGLPVQGAGDPEVHDLRRTGRGDHDVGGLDVAVDQAPVVAGRQRVEDLGGEPQRLGQRQAAAAGRYEVAQGAPFDVLHHQERHPAVGQFLLAHVVHGHHMGVHESGGRPCLAPEPLAAVGVGSQERAHRLDRHGAVQDRIARPVHGRHTARADHRPAPAPTVRHAPRIRTCRSSAIGLPPPGTCPRSISAPSVRHPAGLVASPSPCPSADRPTVGRTEHRRGDRRRTRTPQTASGTAWISSAECPARSWMRWTASAEGAVERQ